MRDNKKSRNELAVAKILLGTAILNAITSLIELIIKLIELE